MCNICGDKRHDALDDNLDDLLGDTEFVEAVTTPAGVEWAMRQTTPAEFAQQALAGAVSDPARPATFEEPCSKCRGRGRFISYAGRDCGPCFTCKGTGKQVFKTSAEAREKARADKAARHAAKMEAWVKAHPAEIEWLAKAAMRGFNFAGDMLTTISKYGDLNDFKLAKVREFMAKDAAREAQQAAAEANAPEIEGAALHKIEKAFATAIDNLVRFPKLRLDTFVFSPAQRGKWAGSIYVKHATETDRDGELRYLGRITEGKFVKTYGCTEEEAERIVAAATDPEASAKAYGQRMGKCSICGRDLTNEESISYAMGPVCREKFGW